MRDFLPSPRLTHKRAFSDDVSQVSPVLEPKAIQSLKPKSDPVSRSSLCINGSHVYGDEPALQSPVPAPRSSAPLPVPSGPRRPEEGFGFAPLHPEPPEAPWGGFERTQQRDEPRFIPSPPSLVLQEELKVSTKAVTLSNHLGRARMEESSRSEGKPTQAAAPSALSAEARQEKRAEETRKEEKKPKGGFFHHGGAKSDAGGRGQGEKTGGSPAAGDERSRAGGWFASKEPKESPQKPRSVTRGCRCPGWGPPAPSLAAVLGNAPQRRWRTSPPRSDGIVAGGTLPWRCAPRKEGYFPWILTSLVLPPAVCPAWGRGGESPCRVVVPGVSVASKARQKSAPF